MKQKISKQTNRTVIEMKKRYKDLIAWIFLTVGILFLVLLLLRIFRVI